jgi:hypothetical protein
MARSFAKINRRKRMELEGYQEGCQVWVYMGGGPLWPGIIRGHDRTFFFVALTKGIPKEFRGESDLGHGTGYGISLMPGLCIRRWRGDPKDKIIWPDTLAPHKIAQLEEINNR